MRNLTRRDFLRVGVGTGAAGIAAASGIFRRKPVVAETVVTTPGEETLVPTVCEMCPAGCGLLVRVVEGRAVKVEGNPLHPLNQGVCCPKGQAALEALYSPERLPGPMQQADGEWQRISWDQAIATVAEELGGLRAGGQAHTVAFLHGQLRGQMRALCQRFMGAYGSPNVISQQSLDEGAARLGLLLTQGINGLPVYDFENAKYLLVFGGSPLEAGRSLMRNLSGIGFMRRGNTSRGRVVVVDPRLSVTGAESDEWVPIRPGTHGALALGMAHVIIEGGLYDQPFVERFTFGFEDFEDEAGNLHMGFKRLVLEEYPPDRVASITGAPAGTIARLGGEFATSGPAIAMLPTSRGSMNSGNGLYTAMAVHALNALVGSIDVPGGVLTQRDLDLAEWPPLPDDPAAEAGRAQERIDGAGTARYPLALSAYQRVADRILADDPYPLSALFLYKANPVFDAPQGRRFAEALRKVPFVVSFSPVLDESTAHADLVLPAATFLEAWGDDHVEGTGYAGIALRQPVVAPIHDTRHPGDVLLALARALGGPLAQALPWSTYKDVVRFRLAGTDVAWDDLVERGVWSQLVYFHSTPGSQAWGEVVGRDRRAALKDGRFDFFSREIHAILGSAAGDRACLPHFELPVDAGAAAEWPFLLISQELMTQPWGWEGTLPSLQEIYSLNNMGRWGSWVDINPGAAESLGIADGDEVWVESAHDRVKARAHLFEGIWPNAVHLPWGQGHATTIAWGRQKANGAQTPGANACRLMGAGSEPLSGLAATGPTRVRVYRA